MVSFLCFNKIGPSNKVRMLVKMSLVDMVKPIENTDLEPVHIRKAVLWGEDDLLSQAIGLFLESNMTWEVIRVSRNGSVGDLMREVKRIKPEVVILREDRVGENSTLPLQLLNEELCTKVISVGLESNLMQVYSRQNVILQGVTDLLSIVETGNYSNCIPEKEV